MDDIWRKTTKKIHEQCVTATQTLFIAQPEVKPTVTATSVAVPTYMNTSAALNTVAQCIGFVMGNPRVWCISEEIIL